MLIRPMMSNPFEEITNKLDGIESLVIDLRNRVSKIEPPKQPKRYITTDEAAEFLNLEKQTVYGLVNHGKIPFKKRGNRLYFDREELHNCIIETEAEK